MTLKNITIREPSHGVVVWSGLYKTRAEAITAYVSELGAEAADYTAVDPHWTDRLEIEF